jgi:DMSO reductase anchor subunit
MRPAFSVIAFTLLSGAGLGLLMWLCVATLVGAGGDVVVMRRALWVAAALTSCGLLASTLHLANPKNAWHSFRQFGSSWLSREGVFAILLYPAAILFAFNIGQADGGALWLAAVTLLLAAAVLVSTGMIYACLRAIPHWHNWQAAVGFPLFALTTGGLLALALSPLAVRAESVRAVVAFLLIAGLLLKYSYYRNYRHIGDSAPSANEALQLGLDRKTGRPNATIRLLDVGHAHGNFLTREFGYELPRKRALGLRLSALLLAFVLPLVQLLWWPTFVWLGFVISLAGLAVERWLFFAEARHVVRRYHGMSMT